MDGAEAEAETPRSAASLGWGRFSMEGESTTSRPDSFSQFHAAGAGASVGTTVASCSWAPAGYTRW
jgi:hypothetical protein